MVDDYILDIKKGIATYEQETLFQSKDSKALIRACIDFLKFLGYKITEPKDFKTNVKNIRELVDFFYKLLENKHPDYVNVYRNFSRDLSIAKRFVEGRIAVTGASGELALQECTKIIKTFFDNEAEFNFKGEIRFEVFGQANMGWVTSKAIQIMNRTIADKVNDDINTRLKNIEVKAFEEYDSGFDLDSILKDMEES